MVIELVTLRSKPGIADGDFLRASNATTKFLLRCKGFLRRRLARSDAGEWLDYLEWESLEDANAAAAQFNRAPETREFNDAIEADSVSMQILTVLSAEG